MFIFNVYKYLSLHSTQKWEKLQFPNKINSNINLHCWIIMSSESYLELHKSILSSAGYCLEIFLLILLFCIYIYYMKDLH